ncbi:hypothetical protein Taro_027304 [Colocasia esculenta]|uniref:RING-type domain-containing protein n=1 Tax=Colocasia esculenta TaxID=4460 RepID=A0A843VE65_COLES|nr:hypothetical protein [Colocasia esculenta]
MTTHADPTSKQYGCHLLRRDHDLFLPLPLPPPILVVSVSLCFGYYGNKQMVLGPNSSRMLAVSSVFVRQVQVRGAAGGGLLLYGFPGEAPAASSLSNWTLSRLMSVGAYGRRGFSLWLNRGSVLKIRWGVVDEGGLNTANVMVVLFKGTRNLELLQQYPTLSYNNSRESTTGGGGAEAVECSVEEDDRYYVGAANLNPHAVLVSMTVEVSAKVYDVTGATFSCSMGGGGEPCKMELLFPKMQYAVLVTPGSDETSDAWYVEVSFVARLMTYFGLVGLLAVLLWIFLRYIHACSEERVVAADQTSTEAAPAETDPIMAARAKEAPCSYGATEEDSETEGSCRCSSEDLYDGKLCVICYEERRSCFFTPCGHCATCNACAKRIMEEESKVCPICRRLIHKVRRLLSP